MRFCPQCHLILETADCGGAVASVCRSCGGLWLPVEGLTACTGGDRESLREHARQFPGIARADTYAGLQLSCPDCRITYLERQPIPSAPDVVHAVCPKCGGTFLEAGARTSLIDPGARTASNGA